ncbi:Cytoplasmic thioredoxin isoenzyme 2 [Orbilia ellipsospora]|uniref:Cytoplasmic thioredoxin isoenzyme 2 n=1 Tax=Orbilia ellipsospora TaxID=2528407 RepID=A0AAV9X118_9PEZI
MSDVTLTEIENLTHFNEFIDKETLTVVDFYTTWCGPCHAFAPTFQALANEYTDANFIKVDIEKAEDVGEKYEITSIPTIMLFRKGEMIEKVKNRGMLGEEIKAQLAA